MWHCWKQDLILSRYHGSRYALLPNTKQSPVGIFWTTLLVHLLSSARKCCLQIILAHIQQQKHCMRCYWEGTPVSTPSHSTETILGYCSQTRPIFSCLQLSSLHITLWRCKDAWGPYIMEVLLFFSVLLHCKSTLPTHRGSIYTSSHEVSCDQEKCFHSKYQPQCFGMLRGRKFQTSKYY